jgi:hypothetical protein
MITDAKNRRSGVFKGNSSIKIIRSGSLDNSLLNEHSLANINQSDELPYEVNYSSRISPRMIIEPCNDDVGGGSVLGSNFPSEVQFANQD